LGQRKVWKGCRRVLEQSLRSPVFRKGWPSTLCPQHWPGAPGRSVPELKIFSAHGTRVYRSTVWSTVSQALWEQLPRVPWVFLKGESWQKKASGKEERTVSLTAITDLGQQKPVFPLPSLLIVNIPHI
jgi:hypothetical protein